MDELSPAQLDELLSELEALSVSLKQAWDDQRGQSSPVQLDQQSVGRVSRVDAIQQQQMALASRLQVGERLKEVSRALEDFAAGDYGFCHDCGEVIAFARLKVKPESLYCVNCQEKNE